MNLLVTLEHRFQQTPDNKIWTKTSFGYSFWLRYLEVFDHVRILARIEETPAPDSGWQRADGEGVSASPVPYYLGPTQYLRRYHAISQSISQALDPNEAVIIRASSILAQHVESRLRPRGQPYGVEVVCDPNAMFAPGGGVKHPLRPFLRGWLSRDLQKLCSNACAVAYVSSHILPQRYSAAPDVFSTVYSSVELTESSFVTSPRKFSFGDAPIRIVTVGSLAQLYKGPDTLIQAVMLLLQRSMNIKLIFVGDGKHRPQLEELVVQSGLKLKEQVCFLGQLPSGKAVQEQLDQADLFVLPSRTEGLPRAMIEAMARGLPCIGSTVGGIPEILPPENMVPPSDAEALADKIYEVITQPERMDVMSANNLVTAKDYHEDILRKRRNTFYRHVKGETHAWQQNTIQ